MFNHPLELVLAVFQFSALLLAWREIDKRLVSVEQIRQLGRGFLTVAAHTVILAVTIFLGARLVRYAFLFEGIFITWNDELLRFSVFLFLVTLLVVAAVGQRLLTNWMDSRQRLATVERENAEFHLEMLKTQINPHFLFNNLNTLGALIRHKPDDATHFLKALSSVYRYILDHREINMVSIQEELSGYEPYRAMMEKRFEHQLTIWVDKQVAETVGTVPSLCLQILTENAIKHNVTSQSRPLTINIEVKEDRLCVSNPLQLKRKKEHSTRIGLNNIRQRLALVTDKELSVTTENDAFSVGIPIISKA